MIARRAVLARRLACALVWVPAPGCEQADLVVAEIHPLEAGAGGSAHATAGEGAAGSGEASAGTGAAGSAGVAGTAGMAGMAGSGEEMCVLPSYYADLAYVDQNNCEVPNTPVIYDNILQHLSSIQAPPPGGENRPPTPCDFREAQSSIDRYFYVDPNDPEQLLVCEPWCTLVRTWARQTYADYLECRAGREDDDDD